MTDITLARLARLEPSDDRGWVCRTRVEHLDWRPQMAAGLLEQSPALGHVRLTRAGRERLAEYSGPGPVLLLADQPAECRRALFVEKCEGRGDAPTLGPRSTPAD